MTKYIRIKSGEANFLLSERFDDVEKAANPNAQGNAATGIPGLGLYGAANTVQEKDIGIEDLPILNLGNSLEELKDYY